MDKRVMSVLLLNDEMNTRIIMSKVKKGVISITKGVTIRGKKSYIVRNFKTSNKLGIRMYLEYLTAGVPEEQMSLLEEVI